MLEVETTFSVAVWTWPKRTWPKRTGTGEQEYRFAAIGLIPCLGTRYSSYNYPASPGWEGHAAKAASPL